MAATAELVVAFSAKLDGLESSLKRVTTRLGDLETSAKKTGESISKSLSDGGGFAKFGESIAGAARQLIAFYATLRGMQAVRDTVLAVDDLNQSITRLRVLTSSSPAAAGNIFSSLATIARQTGQPLAEVTDQFTRFYNATANLGTSSAQVEQFVRVLSQFAQVGGSKPQEAAAAITQLAQGLASGKLQGDELKSILENMPVLAQAMANALNVSVGTLRQMGEEGKLTANVVFPAIIRAGAQMGDRLRDLPLSLRQGWQALSDAATLRIRQMDEEIGATNWLRRLLIYAADTTVAATNRAINPDAPGIPAADAVAAIDQRLRDARANAERLRAAIRGSEEAEARLGTGFSLGRSDLRAQRARDQAELAQTEATIRRNEQRLETLREELDRDAARNASTRDREGREARIRDYERTAREIRESADPILKATRERDERVRALEENLADRRRQAQSQGSAGLDQRLREITQFETQQRAAINRIFEEDKRKAEAGDRAAAERAEAERKRREREDRQLRNEREQAANEIARAGDSGLAGLRQQFADWGTRGENVGSPFEEFLRRAAGSADQLTVFLRALTAEGEKAAAAMVRVGENPQAALDEVETQVRQLRPQMEAAGYSAQQIADAWDIAKNRMINAVQQMGDKAGKTFNDIKVYAVTAFSKELSSAIIDFAVDGKNGFEEMAASFSKNIAKMILDLLIFKAVVSGLGAFGFTIPGLPMPGRMAGGPVRGGSPYIVGEKRPEIFVPGSSGYIYPRVDGLGGGATTVNVYNSSSAGIRTNETTDGQGNKMIEMFVEEVVRKGMASGRFDATMRQNFSVGRPGRI